MSARITIQSGISEGTSHVLEGRVARVGSDPQSEVCLPTNDIPGHALTLEFREDGCLVYNRCRNNVYIGSQAVEPDHVVEWPETDILQLGVNTKLLLDFDVELTDTESSNGGYEEYDSGLDYPGDEVVSTATASKTTTGEIALDKPAGNLAKTALQLGVTIACLAGCVLLLIRDQERQSVPKSGPGFVQIISTALEAKEISLELVKRLQYAEAQRVRGRSDVAEHEYQSIRDDLIFELGRSEQALETPNSQILDFVQTRLSSDP